MKRQRAKNSRNAAMESKPNWRIEIQTQRRVIKLGLRHFSWCKAGKWTTSQKRKISAHIHPSDS